ncbi:uncharacterized protein LOC119666818 [Teleopsis dalmanni]|uniref:uncharacterized protein LOC119666818 n=1 Tax=Teleopsis dalmanni TaxID=139649 RepID=UPI0018CF2181|nr:uncharacterized protein LOC119666818 [Teleopsis dalmanni]
MPEAITWYLIIAVAMALLVIAQIYLVVTNITFGSTENETKECIHKILSIEGKNAIQLRRQILQRRERNCIACSWGVSGTDAQCFFWHVPETKTATHANNLKTAAKTEKVSK